MEIRKSVLGQVCKTLTNKLMLVVLGKVTDTFIVNVDVCSNYVFGDVIFLGIHRLLISLDHRSTVNQYQIQLMTRVGFSDLFRYPPH
jgi:hypothetical protein